MAYCQAGLLGVGFPGHSVEDGYGAELSLHSGYDGGHEEIHVSYNYGDLFIINMNNQKPTSYINYIICLRHTNFVLGTS